MDTPASSFVEIVQRWAFPSNQNLCNRTREDYALIYERAGYRIIRLFWFKDNLNTHNPSSFYEVFEAPEAFALSKRFEMVYTPKEASWLNMAKD